MIVTLVMDQYGMSNNGTTVTAMNFAKMLRMRGHTVRIVTCIEGVQEENVYVVPKRNIPIVNKIVAKHGMQLAHPDVEVLTNAIRGADVVHFFMPFKLAKSGKKIADKLGVASTAAFHVQPENISYNMKLSKVKALPDMLYKSFKTFYDLFNHIHVPTALIHDIISNNYNYLSTAHTISNGASEAFCKIDAVRPLEWGDKFVIVMIGRLSHEKRQDLLIKAVSLSKYNSKIQIILCGKGPLENNLIGLSNKILVNPAIIEFCTKPQLINILNSANLYVHTSEIEVEAISCIEAFSCGLVPIINNTPLSATTQFALTPHNLFNAGSAEDLAKKIEFFMDNPQVVQQQSQQYLQYAQDFTLAKCADKLMDMFKLAISDNYIKLQNSQSERSYLSHLPPMEVRAYNKAKKCYIKNALSGSNADFNNAFITTLQNK